MPDPMLVEWVISVFATLIGVSYVAAGLTLKFLTKNDTQKLNHPGVTFAILGLVILLITHYPPQGYSDPVQIATRLIVIFGVAWGGIDYYRRVIASRDYITPKEGIEAIVGTEGEDR